MCASVENRPSPRQSEIFLSGFETSSPLFRKYKMEAIMSSTDSSTPNRCRECGTPLSAAAPDGFCPCCLIEGALRLGAPQTLDPGSPDQPTAVEDVKVRVGVYDLLEEIGRGGMG